MKMKRIVNFMIILALVLTLLPVLPLSVQAASTPAVDSNGIYWGNGTPLYIVAGTSSGTAVYYYSGSTKVYMNPNGAAGNNLSGTSIYGGGDENAITGNISITMTGGSVGQIIGGCFNNNVTGDISIHVSGGTIANQIRAGCNMGRVYGNVSISVTGGTVPKVNAMGSGSGTGTVSGNANIIITQNASVSEVSGGDGYNSVYGTVTGYIASGKIVCVSAFTDQTIAFDNLIYKNGSTWTTKGNATVPSGVTMTIASGESMNITTGTFTNNGTIVNNGAITGKKVIRNNGSVRNNGTLTLYQPVLGNKPTGSGTIDRKTAYIASSAAVNSLSVQIDSAAHTVAAGYSEQADGKLWLWIPAGDVVATVNGTKYYGVHSSGAQTTMTTSYTAPTNITGIPTQVDANRTVTLSGAVEPSNATFTKVHKYEIRSGSATVSGNKLTALGGGTIVLRAHIYDYYQDFTIQSIFTPVTDISGSVASSMVVNGSITLPTQVSPGNASYSGVTWSIVSNGASASITDGKLKPTATGSVTIRATVVNGLAYGSNFTKDYTIQVTPLGDTLDISVGNIVITEKNSTTNTVTYAGFSSGSKDFPKTQNINITGQTDSNYIQVNGTSAILTIRDFTSRLGGSTPCLDLQNSASVSLWLAGSNTMNQTYGNNEFAMGVPAIHVTSGTTLTIEDAGGSLDASSVTTAIYSSTAAAIGGGKRTTVTSNSSDAGTVIINGGVVNATAEYGAAIGGGNKGAAGTVIINGGKVTAKTINRDGVGNNALGAGIGSGCDSTTGGTVTINGGVVVASTEYGSSSVKSIGAGLRAPAATVVITGGNISAAYISGAPTNGEANGNQAVSKVTITLPDVTAETAITKIDSPAYYGMNDVTPLDTNKLYLYLPAGTDVQSVTTSVGEYTRTNTPDGEAWGIVHTCDFSQGACPVCGAYAAPAKDDNGVYLIGTAEDLMGFSWLVNLGEKDADAMLTADIDMTGMTDYWAIGSTGLYYNAEGEDKGYTGTFDGNGYVIRNLTIAGSNSAQRSYGIFGTLSGTVKHLGVEAFTFQVGSQDCRAGGIAGQVLSGGFITDCYVVNSSVLTGNKVAGGIAGCNYGGTIENCYAYGNTVTATRAGGIVGDNRGDVSETDRPGTIINCYTDASDIENSQRTGAVENSTAGVSAETFAGGEITYKLNGSTAKGALIWFQTLSGENAQSYPQFSGRVVSYDSPTGTYMNHEHTWAYRVREDGTQLNAYCAGAGQCGHNSGNGGSASMVPAEGASLVYTGAAIEPLVVTYSDDWMGTTELTISYSDNIHAGTAKGTLTVDGATATQPFTIRPADLSAAEVSGISKLTYNGASQTQKPTVTWNGVTLAEGVDYTFSGNTATNAGSYTLTVTGKGNFEGSVSKSWSISKLDISAIANVGDFAALAYNRAPQIPVAPVTVKTEKGTETVEGAWAAVTDVGGKTRFTVSADSVNFTGSVTGVDPGMQPLDIATTELTMEAEAVYNGYIQEPAVTSDGITLSNGDYTIQWDTPAIDAGSYTATITGKGNYTGSVTRPFTITQKTLTISGIKADSRSYNGTTAVVPVSIGLDGFVFYSEGDYVSDVLDFDDVYDDVYINTDVLKANVSSAVPGEYATVNLSNIVLTGEDAPNYTIASAMEAVPLKNDYGHAFNIGYVVLRIEPQDQYISQGDGLDQTKYTVNPEGYTVTGILLYVDDYGDIAVNADNAKVTCNGEDVTDYCELETYATANLVEVCQGHSFNANGFCATGKCDNYEPAVKKTAADEYGSEIEIYEIWNAGQLYWFAQQVNEYGNTSINGKVMANITVNTTLDENARSWTPIGRSYPCYTGNFDGNGYTISGLYFNNADARYVGLFGYTDYGYTIQNVHISNSHFAANTYVGALIGYAGSNISGCTVDSTVTVIGENDVGGLVGGSSYGTLENSWSAASVPESASTVGGLVGRNSLMVSNCYTTHSRLVGYNNDSYGGSVTNCYYLSETETEDGGKTAEQFASGEVAYLLQSGIVGEDIYDEDWNWIGTAEPEHVWGQEIGVQGYPVLDGMKVYKLANGYTNELKISIYGKTLALEDIVRISYYFTLGDITDADIAASGLQVWNEAAYAAAGDPTYTVEGLTKNGSYYNVLSRGIPAKNMGDMIYARAYVTLADGTEVYSDVIEYSAAIYAENQYKKTTDAAIKLKPVVIALMNYGAAAQVKFGYNADSLMNSFLSADEQITAWDDTCLNVSAEDTAGKYALQTEGSANVITKINKSLSLEGALNVNIYGTIGIADAQEVGVLYWSEAAYASAEALTADNAVKLATVNNGSLKQATISNVAAKNMSNDCYVCVYVIDAEGNTHYSELVCYNAHNYAANQIAKNQDAALMDLCKAIVVYGNAAEAYFNS